MTTRQDKESEGNSALALPLRALEVGAPGGFALGWCAVDANDRVLGYAMTQAQAEQLVAPFQNAAIASVGTRDEIIEKCARLCEEARLLISETKPVDVAREAAFDLARQIRGLKSAAPDAYCFMFHSDGTMTDATTPAAKAMPDFSGAIDAGGKITGIEVCLPTPTVDSWPLHICHEQAYVRFDDARDLGRELAVANEHRRLQAEAIRTGEQRHMRELAEAKQTIIEAAEDAAVTEEALAAATETTHSSQIAAYVLCCKERDEAESRIEQLERELADANAAAAHYVRDEPNITPRRAMERQAAEIERLKLELAEQREHYEALVRHNLQLVAEHAQELQSLPSASALNEFVSSQRPLDVEDQKAIAAAGSSLYTSADAPPTTAKRKRLEELYGLVRDGLGNTFPSIDDMSRDCLLGYLDELYAATPSAPATTTTHSELIGELREWSEQHLAMTAIEIIEEAQGLMNRAADAVSATPSAPAPTTAPTDDGDNPTAPAETLEEAVRRIDKCFSLAENWIGLEDWKRIKEALPSKPVADDEAQYRAWVQGRISDDEYIAHLERALGLARSARAHTTLPPDDMTNDPAPLG